MVAFLTTGNVDKSANIAVPDIIPENLKESFKQFLASLSDDLRK